MSSKRKFCHTVQPGKARSYLIQHFTLPSERSEHVLCLNGHVLLLYFKSDKSETATSRAVKELFGISPTPSHVKGLVAKTKNMICSIHSESMFRRLQLICNDVFVVRCRSLSTTACPPLSASAPKPESEEVESAPPSVLEGAVSGSVEEPLPSVDSDPRPSTSTDPGPSVSLPSTPPPRLRSSGATPREKLLRKRLFFMSASCAKLKETHRQRTQILKEEHRQSTQILKKKMKAVPRKIRAMKKAMKKELLAEIPTAKEVRKHEANIRRLKKRHKANNERQKARVAQLKSALKAEHQKELKEKNDMIRELNYKLMEAEEMVHEMTTTEEKPTKKTKTYSTDIRLAVYDAVQNQVPTKNIPVLISQLAKRFQVKIGQCPSRSTVECMVRELGLICDLQAAEKAMQNDNLTLGFDATTQEGVHISSVHFTTKDECQVVAIDQLAGGRAEDYAAHITESLDHLAEVYAEVHHCDFQQTRSSMIDHISNSMTDRAAVNHATVVRVNAVWEKSITELNCNLHPLDTIASSCRSALKLLETQKGFLCGKDCMAGNIVLQMNKLRYRDGKGDPRAFLSFLNDQNLPKGIIPRYRGNRLHILFHTCAVFVQHFDKFLYFLKSGPASCVGLQVSLLKDFSSDTALREMYVLAIIGKLLTGPWMKAFYTSAEGSINYAEAIATVKRVLAIVVEASKDPMSLLSRNVDFFGNLLDDSAVKIVSACPKDELVRDMLQCCLDAVISVLKRQYKRYYETDLTEQLVETESARVHNMDAEEVMGMFSAAKRRAPNATLAFLSAKLRSTKNQVFKYLDSLDADRREEIIKWARRKTHASRERNRRKHEELMAELSRRSAAKSQRREEQERKRVELALKDLEVKDIMSAFPGLEKKAFFDLTDVLGETIVGRDLCRTLFESDQTCQIYNGRVRKLVREEDMVVYVVACWSPEETFDEAVDYDMPKLQLAADIVLGDLILS